MFFSMFRESLFLKTKCLILNRFKHSVRFFSNCLQLRLSSMVWDFILGDTNSIMSLFYADCVSFWLVCERNNARVEGFILSYFWNLKVICYVFYFMMRLFDLLNLSTCLISLNIRHKSIQLLYRT